MSKKRTIDTEMSCRTMMSHNPKHTLIPVEITMVDPECDFVGVGT